MEEVDCIVVGAGMAGLICARDLVRGGKSAVVLEARDRCGGKLLTENGIDLGGAFIGLDHHHVLALCKEMGATLVDAARPGRSVGVLENGRSFHFEGTPNGLGMLALLDLNALICEIHRLCENVSEAVGPLDNVTVEEWIKSHAWTTRAACFFSKMAKVFCCVELSDISMQFFLLTFRQAGGLQYAMSVKDGAQEKTVAGGTHASLCVPLASQLDVRYESPVSHIEILPNRTAIVTHAGGKIKCNHVVLAMPAPLLEQIEYSPPLPSHLSASLSSCVMGDVIKTFTCYSTPWWRSYGLSGEIFSLEPGLVSFGMDVSDDKAGSYRLLSFIVAEEAARARAMTREARAQAISEWYAHTTGCQEALSPIEYVEQDWALEPYSRGGYEYVLSPGKMHTLDILRHSVDNVLHFASSELSPHHTGYMEGAIESGKRAAATILGVDPEPYEVEMKKCPSIVERYLIPSVPSAITLGCALGLGVASIAYFRFSHLLRK